MGFLSSIYLWLLPLATLPILIHLFFNKNFKTIHFSSIEFLRILKVDSIKKVKILEILLLLIRTLIILCIILMLSKPIIKSDSSSSFSTKQEIFCILALDDSFSLTKSSNPPTIRDFYSLKIRQVLETLPSKSRLKVITISDTANVYDGLKESFSIDDLKGKMKFTSNKNQLLSTYLKSLDTPFKKEIHIFTDMQSTLFEEKIEMENQSDLFIHRIPPMNNNISIVNVKLNEDIIALNKEIEIIATIQNNGVETAKNALLMLIINDINIGQKQIDLEPGETKQESFKTILTTPGNHIASFELVHDNHLGDNKFYFPIKIKENLDISVISNNSEDDIYIKNSLKALSPLYSNLNIYSLSDVLNNQNILINSDISMVYGYNLLSKNNLEEPAIDNLNNGGHIYIFPNSAPYRENDLFDYTLFDQNNIELVEYSSNSYHHITEEQIIDKSIKNIFINRNNPKSSFIKLYKHYKFNSNQNPFIVVDGHSIWNRMDVGLGKFHILGFTPSLEWTDLPLKATFISFVDYLLKLPSSKENKAFEVGDRYRKTENDVSIKTPNNKMYKIEKNNTDFIFYTPGLYSIQKKNKAINYFVNPPNDELDFQAITNEGIKETYKNVYIIDNQSDLERFIKESRIGVELWKFFLYMAIFLIIIEMVISNQLFRRI